MNKRCWDCCVIKSCKQFLQIIRYAINWLWSIFDFDWSENCVITSKAIRDAVAGDNPVLGINAPITDTKSYAPVVTLSTEDDNKLLEQLKTGFKRTISANIRLDE